MLRRLLLLLSVIFGAISVLSFRNYNYGLTTTILWLLSCILWFSYIFYGQRSAKINKNDLLLSLVVFAVGLTVGLYKINTLPIGVWTDEIEISMAGKGALDSMLTTKNFIPFTPQATGHPGLTIIFTGIGIDLFGKTILGLRFPSVFFGALSALAFYFLLKERFSRQTSFWVSLIFSVSYWHLALSRLAYEASFYWFFEILCLIFLVKFLKTKSIHFLGLIGLFAGLGIYTYLAFRILAVGFIAVILLVSLIEKIGFKKILLGLLVFLISLGAVITPIFIYSRQWPEQIYQRSNDVSILNPKFNSVNRIQMITDNSLKTLLMFGFKGDPNYRHNPAQSSEMDVVSFLLLLAGVYLIFIKKEYSLITAFAIIGAISAGNGVFTYEPPYITEPHSLRTLGFLPVVYFLAAYSFNYLSGRKNKVIPIAVSLIIIFLNLYTYFSVKPSAALADATQYNFTQTALLASQDCGKDMVISSNLINQTHYDFFAKNCHYSIFNASDISKSAFYLTNINDSQILINKGFTNFISIGIR